MGNIEHAWFFNILFWIMELYNAISMPNLIGGVLLIIAAFLAYRSVKKDFTDN